MLFGAVFVLIGVLGFVPAFTPQDSNGMPLLLGLFMVGVVHNIIHLLSGVAAPAKKPGLRLRSGFFDFT